MIVHRTTAQEMTWNISSFEDVLPDSFERRKVSFLELCDKEAMRNPISPLATLAKPTSRATAYGGVMGADSF